MKTFDPPHTRELLEHLELLQKIGCKITCVSTTYADDLEKDIMEPIASWDGWWDPSWSRYRIIVNETL